MVPISKSLLLTVSLSRDNASSAVHEKYIGLNFPSLNSFDFEHGWRTLTIWTALLDISSHCLIFYFAWRNSRRGNNTNKLSNEIQKSLLVRKSLDSLSRNCTRSVDSVAAIDFVMTPMMTSSAARTIWPPPQTTSDGARTDDYFVPHKYSLRTHNTTEAGDGRDRRSLTTDFGSTVSTSDPIEDGCRYHACLMQKTVIAAETEMGGGGISSFKAPGGDANAAAAASAAVVQPMYSASSGYGNSSASLNLAEHIYEIPEWNRNKFLSTRRKYRADRLHEDAHTHARTHAHTCAHDGEITLKRCKYLNHTLVMTFVLWSHSNGCHSNALN